MRVVYVYFSLVLVGWFLVKLWPMICPNLVECRKKLSKFIVFMLWRFLSRWQEYTSKCWKWQDTFWKKLFEQKYQYTNANIYCVTKDFRSLYWSTMKNQIMGPRIVKLTWQPVCFSLSGSLYFMSEYCFSIHNDYMLSHTSLKLIVSLLLLKKKFLTKGCKLMQQQCFI